MNTHPEQNIYLNKIQCIVIYTYILKQNISFPWSFFSFRCYTSIQHRRTQQCKLTNTLRPRQNGRHFADGIIKCIYVNENHCILLRFSPKFIDNMPALVQVMAWCQIGNNPVPEPMMTFFLNLLHRLNMRHSTSMSFKRFGFVWKRRKATVRKSII